MGKRNSDPSNPSNDEGPLPQGPAGGADPGESVSSSESGITDRRQRAENILSVHRSQHEKKEALDIDALCAEHPGLADELRSVLEDWEGDGSGGSRTLTVPGPTGSDPEQIGPYHILEKIGEGGMGVVYVAEQREPVRRKVALKVIKWGMDTKEVVTRFEAERQALALMNHPNIAKVYDAGATPEGRPYFVMEHVPGDPLTGYCDRERLSTQERLDLFILVCQAVQHAQLLRQEQPGI